ncbi:MAG: ABC transporter ATP-binding protein [Candidatus Izimaplasma sp.]|nr:ABC transporter ATP-binding protein [Candidatus Izimaplasma bacterium]
MSVLTVKNLGISFGGLRAVDNFDISIENDELVGLIGPNGAGKTTIFNLLTGVYIPTDGDILINNKSTLGKKPNEIVMLGSSRTFQNIRLFKNMTVLDNIKIAYHNRMSYGLFGSIFKTKKYRLEENKAVQIASELLDVFGLDMYKNDLAKNLPYGKQRKLEIARALATNPKILLLDEPAAGMNPQETEELMETIKLLKKQFDISILLIEHDMRLVMGICERIVVIDYGKIIAKGNPEAIRTNPDVIKAYLGE